MLININQYKCTNLIIIILRWGTVYAHQNLTAKEFFSDWDDGLNHTGSVPAVSWWKVGKVIFVLMFVSTLKPFFKPDFSFIGCVGHVGVAKRCHCGPAHHGAGDVIVIAIPKNNNKRLTTMPSSITESSSLRWFMKMMNNPHPGADQAL